MLPLNLIQQSNPEINANAIKIGQEIQIPGFSTVSYSIKRGDSLWKLATTRNTVSGCLAPCESKYQSQSLNHWAGNPAPAENHLRDINPRTNYDYARLTRDIQVLREHFPFIRVRSIGESVEGIQFYEIRLGTGKKKVHLDASFHANEWITTPVLMSFLNTFLLGLTNSSQIRGLSMMPLYQTVDLSIVPMVNPDGVRFGIEWPAPCH